MPNNMLKCKICWNENNNKLLEVREMMFGFKDKFNYFQCSQCNCLQILEIPSDMYKYYPETYYSFSKINPITETIINKLLKKFYSKD